MYHLLVSANADSWTGDPWVIEADRSLRKDEYTKEPLAARYGSLDDEAIEELLRFPCIFAFETAQGLPAKIGWLKRIRKRGGDFRVEYELNPDYPSISNSDLIRLKWELDIGDFELNRTHWALKGESLADALLSIGYPELSPAMVRLTANMKNPTAFISYSWDSTEHKDWVCRLATRLRADGIDVKLDQWHVAPGDQLPQFMEREIRDNDYVLIICTPNYRKKSDARAGGVGYEGDIMTGEVFNAGNDRKFIPILASGSWQDVAPSWLRGKYRIDLGDGSDFEAGYNDLITTIHGTRPTPPPLGPKPATVNPVAFSPSSADAPILSPKVPSSNPEERIKILGVVVDEVTEPTMDGTTGSALYRIPFRLSQTPSVFWREHFVAAWNSPPRYTSMHRPGIARVVGDKIILDGTTIEEVEHHHRETLTLCVGVANVETEKAVERVHREAHIRKQKSGEHRRSIRDIADRLGFD